MKQLLILILVILPGFSCFAQKRAATHAQPIEVNSEGNHSFSKGNPAKRTTAIGDTLSLSNIADTATLTLYTFGISDSGFVYGTNYQEDQAFAERYDFNGYDSSIEVIGVYASFGGTVNPASNRTITIYAWDVDAPFVVNDSLLYSGFPGDILAGVSVPVTQLGIGTTTDTVKAYLFPYPTSYLSRSFFVGYNINYAFASLDGDTIGLASSLNGDRTSPKSSFIITDTTFNFTMNVQNATMTSDFNWHDNYYDIDSLSNDLAIYPIVVIGSPALAAVKGVTRNNLTFFGNYPNPATDYTNIKFSLLKSADVTIQIMDMSGRQISSISNSHLSNGEHIIPVNTSAMPAGDYFYFIHTSGGDGMAGKMTINP